MTLRICWFGWHAWYEVFREPHETEEHRTVRLAMRPPPPPPLRLTNVGGTWESDGKSFQECVCGKRRTVWMHRRPEPRSAAERWEAFGELPELPEIGRQR